MIERFVSTKFNRQYKKLPKSIKETAEEKETIFVQNPFDPRLDTHKLHGKDREFWAYSINQSVRIKFEFLGNREVYYVDIGPHDTVYK